MQSIKQHRRRRLLQTTLALALVAVGCGPSLESATYTATDEIFANPERGFYLPEDTHSQRYESLDVQDLLAARSQRHISLVYRGFILDEFADAPVSAQYLQAMAADFGALRQAGMKAIVRFAYTTRVITAPGTDWPPVQPYGDASLERVLSHIEQLQPLLRSNADVIAVVQAGFVGIWGEWYYTDHYAGADLDEPTAAHWAARRQIVTRLLAALPEQVAVQMRTPLQKQRLTGTGEALTPKSAFGATAAARLGHHNDCFLASADDFGTYRDTTADFAYLQSDSRFVPVGGETCAPNPPRSECASAVGEMERFHWSYLNSGYHPRVLDSWQEGGCLSAVQRRLGYRLSLTGARFEPAAKASGVWQVELDMTNSGFAAPFRQRPVTLVLRQRNSSRAYGVDLDTDLRRLLPGDTLRVEARIGLPKDMPTGDYDVFLHLGDPDPDLVLRPEYAIRLAMVDTWQPVSGYNHLGFALTVKPGRSWWPARATVQLAQLP